MLESQKPIPGWGNRPEIRTHAELFDWFNLQTAPHLATLRQDQCVVHGTNTGEQFQTIAPDSPERQHALWILQDAISRAHDWMEENPVPDQPERPKVEMCDDAIRAVSVLKVFLGRQSAGATGDGSPAVEYPKCYVTLLQAACMVNKSKAHLERCKAEDSSFPVPAIVGRKGQANEWLWSEIRPWLEEKFGKPLPERFPA